VRALRTIEESCGDVVGRTEKISASEEAYWDAAGLTLHELLYSPALLECRGTPLGGE